MAKQIGSAFSKYYNNRTVKKNFFEQSNGTIVCILLEYP